MSTDPCNCSVLCPHGNRCLGGHADYPGSHWWHCETCSPPAGQAYRLANGETLMVVSGAGE